MKNLFENKNEFTSYSNEMWTNHDLINYNLLLNVRR